MLPYELELLLQAVLDCQRHHARAVTLRNTLPCSLLCNFGWTCAIGTAEEMS